MTLDGLIAKHVFNLPPEHSETPSWSTDIAKAWQVVEEMERRGWEWLMSKEYSRYSASFQHNDCDLSPKFVRAETAPRAICLAALAALEVTNE